MTSRENSIPFSVFECAIITTRFSSFITLCNKNTCFFFILHVIYIKYIVTERKRERERKKATKGRKFLFYIIIIIIRIHVFKMQIYKYITFIPYLLIVI